MVLDLGMMPLAGDFRPVGEINERYPLAIDGCRVCGLLQVREPVPFETLFGPDYHYASSTVPSLVRHFESYAEAVSGKYYPRGTRILEVGCNDGIFMEPLIRRGFDVVGLDASDNVAEMARRKGLWAHTGRFDADMADALTRVSGRFNVVTCSNTFAHDPNLSGFLDALDLALGTGGEFWVEVHDAISILDGLQWDFFYHEHCLYWTIHSLCDALSRRGYSLLRWGRTPMHGGSIRAAFRKDVTPIVSMPGDRLPTPQDWQAFARRAWRSKEILKECVHWLPVRYAYGASGRATTMINWSAIGDRIAFVVDGSPLRYGKAVPGTGIPIKSEEEFFSNIPPGWCLVTAFTHIDDIRRKVETRAGRPVTMVTPIPQVSVS